MRSDLSILRDTWRSIHPGLYRYNTPGQIDNYFKDAFERTGTSLSTQDFFILLSQLNVKLKCGHTFVSYYNQKKAVENELFSTRYLPILFRVIDGKLVVTHNLTDKTFLKRGSEIISVNGVKSDAIIDTLLTVSKADGNNGINKKLDNISIYPVDISPRKYTLFDIFFPLFYERKKEDSTYEISIRKPNGKFQKVQLQTISKEQRQRAYIEKYGELPSAEKSWFGKELNHNTFLLHIGDFAVYNWSLDFRHYLDSLFQNINNRSYENLVLDIRQNEGGSDDARDEVISYLIKRPIPCPSDFRRLYRFLSIPDSLQPYLKTWDESFKKPKSAEQFIVTEDGYYENKSTNSGCDSLFPKPNHFKGNVFLLTDVTNSSTTFLMADAFKRNKIGTIVGETTGGTQQGINGGEILFLYLPNSSIEMDVPLVYQAPRERKPDEGVHPDFRVKSTAKDIASGNDPQVQFILTKLVGKKR